MVSFTKEGETYLDRWVDAAIFKVLPSDHPTVGYVDFAIDPQLFLNGEALER